MTPVEYNDYGRMIANNLLDVGPDNYVRATIGAEPFAKFDLEEVLQNYQHFNGNLLVWISPTYRTNIENYDRIIRTVECSYIVLSTGVGDYNSPEHQLNYATEVSRKIDGYLKTDFENFRNTRNVLRGFSQQILSNVGTAKLHGVRVYWSFTELRNHAMGFDVNDWLVNGLTQESLIPWSTL